MKRLLASALTLLAIATAGATLPNDDQTIVHVLNRMAFGPRAGDVERVKRIGLQTYVDEQLHPERIPDQSMAPRLAGLATVGMRSRDIAEEFERPAIEARRQQQKPQPPPPGAGDAPQGRSPEHKALQQRA